MRAKLTAAGLVAAVAAGSAHVAAAPVRHTGRYASPNGLATNDGTYARPWNLATALAGGGGRVTPGDTIWLRGGTYRGSFRATMSGNANARIVVRQFPGERAIIDGAGTPGKAQSILYVGGQYLEFRDFEMTNSDAVRTTALRGNGIRPDMIVNHAAHTRYINLVVHDGGVALYTEPDYADVEIAGCIFYNNGWQGPDRGHGHALYLKSYTGPVVARDNIIFNQFGYGIHAYTNAGSGELNNIRLEGNVSFDNGSLSTTGTSANILLGGDGRATGDVLASNYTWFSPTLRGTNVKVGYGTLRNGDVELTNNYFAGGSPVLETGYWTQATITANTFIGTANMVRMNDPSATGHVWSSNTWHRNPASSAWKFGATSFPFAGWQAAAGVGLGDIGQARAPATTLTVVRPNPHEAGRAHVIVYNWARLGSVAVDLGTVLHAGDRYEIRNVQDLFGAPVASGTYAGPVTLSLAGVAPPAPVGWTAHPAPRTGPDFDVFVVRKI